MRMRRGAGSRGAPTGGPGQDVPQEDRVSPASPQPGTLLLCSLN